MSRPSPAPDAGRDRTDAFWLRQLADPALSRAIQVAATLGIADLLTDGPRSASALAGRLGCHSDALARLLRYLAFAGVFAEDEQGFGLTALSRLLRTGEPGSLRSELSIGADDRAWWWSTGEMLHAIRTGNPAYDRVFGMSLWEAMARGGGSSGRFQEAMSHGSRELAGQLSAAYDWLGVSSIVDVGGGVGTVLATLLADHPRMTGTLVDVAPVAESARQSLAQAGLDERVRVVVGDFFGGLPAGGDVYLLFRVLHDWADDAATRVLRCCRKACGTGGRVIVVDMEIGRHDPDGIALGGDIAMLLLAGGRERTSSETAGLLGAAGFAVTSRLELRRPYVAIVATPV